MINTRFAPAVRAVGAVRRPPYVPSDSRENGDDMIRCCLMAAMILAAMAGAALAQSSTSLIGGGQPSTSLIGGGQQPSTSLIAPASPGPSTMQTSRGTAVVTGNPGSVQTGTLLGSSTSGVLTRYGNGSTTLSNPGGAPVPGATSR